MSNERFARMIRWYPPQWRSRYGDEMVALLEDTHGSAGEVPVRDRVGLARAGLAERARVAGLTGSAQGPEGRLRSGSALVLCGWALLLVASAVFGKFTDNWYAGTPRSGRWVASSSITALTVAAAVGCGIVLVAALCALPACARTLHGADRKALVGALRRAAASAAVAAVLLAGVVAWAHHLSPYARNGGLPAYGVALVVVSLVVVGALVSATAGAVSVARRGAFSVRTLRVLASMALGLVGLMGIAFAGFVTWWASESVRAPAVLSNGIGNGIPFASSMVPPTLLAAGILMLSGLMLGLVGAARISRALVARPAAV